jgi:hypothetical protein
MDGGFRAKQQRCRSRPTALGSDSGASLNLSPTPSTWMIGVVAIENEPIYQSDPAAADDSGFEPGSLRHLVAGRRGRLLDPRRTPIRVSALDMQRGFFDVEILAFEDAGAHWLIPLESVGQYQFEPGSDASAAAVDVMEARIAVLSRPFAVAAEPEERELSLRRLAEERAGARKWLDNAGLIALHLDPLVRDRLGDPAIYAILDGYLRDRDIADIETRFAETFVSNARSGEVVKGHAIVLAELGLCPFAGTVVRDPALFHGRWSKERLGRHLIGRMAFVQALFERSGPLPVALFRGFNVATGTLPAPRPSSFVSASFSIDVAMAHFRAGPPTSSAALFRQPLSHDRLFMTFVETAAMNRNYREAEAVLIGDPGNRAF